MFAIVLDDSTVIGPFAREEDAEEWVATVDCTHCRIVSMVHPTTKNWVSSEGEPADRRHSPYHRR